MNDHRTTPSETDKNNAIASVGWHIFNPSGKPAHKKHVKALLNGMHELGLKVTNFHEAGIVYIQTTGVRAPLVMLQARLRGKKVIYYYHEPGSLPEKFRKRDPWHYALAVKFVQTFEYLFSNVILVSSSMVKAKLRRAHPVLSRLSRKRVLVAPLVIPDEFTQTPPHRPERPTVLFLGRSHPDHRQFALFARLAARMPEIDFAVLTRNDIPDDARAHLRVLHEGSFFTDEQRLEALSRADVVWTPYDVAYNQSGVIPDALCAGCAVIISDLELMQELHEAPISLTLPTKETPDETRIRQFIIEMHERHEWRRKQARAFYRQFHGPESQLRTLAAIIRELER